MLQALRKNNKKILAVLGVLLMIAFVADMGFRQNQPGQDGNEVMGRYGGTKLVMSDFRRATGSWEFLTKNPELMIRQPQVGPDGQIRVREMNVVTMTLARELMPLVRAALMQQIPFANPRMLDQFVVERALEEARRIADRIDGVTYALLLAEAKAMGVRPNPVEVDQELKNLEQSFPTNSNPRMREEAIREWMTIVEAMNRVKQSVKVSPAEATHILAEVGQQMSLQLVEFKADDFKLDAEPTSAQLQEFFDKYKAVQEGTGDTGVGFRVPKRVKVQYVKVPREQVMKGLKDDQIYEYYKRNKERFDASFVENATTQAAAQAATQPSTRPSTQPTTHAIGAATQPATQAVARAEAMGPALPTTQPAQGVWKDAKIHQSIKEELADQKARTMAQSILSQMEQRDWPVYRQAARAAGTTLPANLPASTLGQPYPAYTYLMQLREWAQKRDPARVMPETGEEGELKGLKELGAIPGLGQAQANQLPFATYALDYYEPFMDDAQRRQAQDRQIKTLAPYQPSPLLTDGAGNYYIFRITEGQASHEPPALAAVESVVRTAYQKQQQYLKAKEAAQKLVESARGKGGLQQAINDLPGSHKLVVTELFSRGMIPPPLKLPQNAAEKFNSESTKLVNARVKTGDERPLGLIELPAHLTVYAAQLNEAKPAEMGPFFAHELARIQADREEQRQAVLVLNWFDPEQVKQRMYYVPTEKPREEQKAGGSPAAPPRPLGI